MERLTHRYTSGMAWASIFNVCACGESECTGPIIDRLAAYEDAMTIDRAQELALAEKCGRLAVLPCKVGDVVWVNDDCVSDWSGKPMPYKCWVFGIEITGKGKRFHVECYKTGRVFPFDFDKFGKTIFLTREEAETALAERKKAEYDN